MKQHLARLSLLALAAAMVAAPVAAQPKHCPPGLAKKNPPCVPPGLAKTAPYGVGDRISRDYSVIERPRRYGLDADRTYYRVGDYVFLVDRNTREVLDVIGAVASLLD